MCASRLLFAMSLRWQTTCQLGRINRAISTLKYSAS